MVDKKTATIAVLCVATVLCLGLWANAAQESRTLKDELGALEDSYDSLSAEHVKIVEDYDRLETVNREIMEKKAQLLEEYTAHKDQLNIVTATLSSTQSSLEDLQTELVEDRVDHETLKISYDRLVEDYEALQNSYLKLYEDYKDLISDFEILGPASKSTTVGFLEIGISTPYQVYRCEDSFPFTAIVRYTNGTEFNGYFRLHIKWFPPPNVLRREPGYDSDRFTIYNGYGEYEYGPPTFIHGPGKYKVEINDFETFDGIRNYEIIVGWGVIVEVR